MNEIFTFQYAPTDTEPSGEIFAIVVDGGDGIGVTCNGAYVQIPPPAYSALVGEILARAPAAVPETDPPEGSNATPRASSEAETPARPDNSVLDSDAARWRCGDESLRAAWVAKLINAQPSIASEETIEALRNLAHHVGRTGILALLEDFPHE